MIHNSSSGAAASFILSENRNNPVEAVDLQKSILRSEEDIFDSALGERALGQMYGLSFPYKSECKSFHVGVKKMIAFGRIYYTRLNMRSMDVTTARCDSAGSHNTQENVRPIHQAIYNGFSLDFKPVTDSP